MAVRPSLYTERPSDPAASWAQEAPQEGGFHGAGRRPQHVDVAAGVAYGRHSHPAGRPRRLRGFLVMHVRGGPARGRRPTPCASHSGPQVVRLRRPQTTAAVAVTSTAAATTLAAPARATAPLPRKTPTAAISTPAANRLASSWTSQRLRPPGGVARSRGGARYGAGFAASPAAGGRPRR